MKENGKEIIYKAGAVLIALALWQLAAMTIGMDILLVSPVKVIVRLFTVWKEDGFIGTILYSLIRIMSGFLIALASGFLLALAAGRIKVVEYLLWPYVVTFKAVPVASFIIMCLIWLSYSQLTVFISFLIVFPVIYSNVLTGLKNTDKDLIEMADVFKLSYGKRFKYIYMPGVRPYLESSCVISVGMAFKAGVAAEVIGVVDGSIGEKLYEAKIYFQSADLFAWTIILVVMSVLLEKLFSKLVHMIFAAGAKSHVSGKSSLNGNDESDDSRNKKTDMGHDIVITNLNKSFGDKEVLNNLSRTFPAGQISYISGPSGSGKTTLFRIISGLTEPDSGNISGISQNGKIGYVFQEDRLCNDFSVFDNVALVCGGKVSRSKVMEHLNALGLGSEYDRKVSDLSGGMKRRVAIARAIYYDAPVILLDEPFNGLDDKLKDSVIDYVRRETEGKTVLLITHDNKEKEMILAEME